MQKRLKPNPLFWWGGAAVVLLATLWLYPRIGRAGQPTILVDHSEGGIRYTAAFDPVSQRVNGMVGYDYLSDQGVQEYLAFNRRASQAIAQRDGGTVRIKVLFSRPLSQAEFEQFVQTYDVTVHNYRMRAVEADGLRVTIDGAPVDGKLIPPEYFNDAVSDVQTRNAAEFKGWVTVEVTTDPVGLRSMVNDPKVFITEATYALIYDAITPEALRKAGAAEETIRAIQEGTDRSLVQITGPPLYWFLEDTGLVPMPVHSQQQGP